MIRWSSEVFTNFFFIFWKHEFYFKASSLKASSLKPQIKIKNILILFCNIESHISADYNGRQIQKLIYKKSAFWRFRRYHAFKGWIFLFSLIFSVVIFFCGEFLWLDSAVQFFTLIWRWNDLKTHCYVTK
jgi:hypothetical protein